METITFTSEVVVVRNMLHADKLYEDIEKFTEEQKKRLNLKKLGRWHPLQHILNSTSGRYVSPTAMKSFMASPADYLFNKLFPDERGTAASVGTTYHEVMEHWYLEEQGNRTVERLWEIAEEIIKKDEQDAVAAEEVRFYVKAYLEGNDYLTGKAMDHNKLVCATEKFIKAESASPLGVTLPVPLYCLIDRVDFRENGIIVVDYKTGGGRGNASTYLLGENGYLPQMIMYKWVVENEYGESVKDVYLCLPGGEGPDDKYVRMNTNSLVEQSKVIENIFSFVDTSKQAIETKKFEIGRVGYTRHLKKFVDVDNPSNNDRTVIPITIEVEDRQYNEDD